MPVDYKRTDRIAEVMQRELAHIVQYNLKDPRLTGFLTISAVKVTKDLSHANVHFTVFNADPATTASLLNGSSSYMRTMLAKNMTLRTVPQLHFMYDQSVEYGNYLSRLIDSVCHEPDQN
jgi:ribosome-binding factor A